MDHPIQNDDGVEFCDGRPPRKETFKKPRMNKKPKRSSADNAALLEVLQRRFENHMHCHSEVEWATVGARLDGNSGKLQALHEMEDSGGEPDVTSYDQETGEIVFFDCSTELRRAAQAIVTTAKDWIRGKNISPQILSWISRPPWALMF